MNPKSLCKYYAFLSIIIRATALPTNDHHEITTTSASSISLRNATRHLTKRAISQASTSERHDWIEPQWQTSGSCQGAPNAMFTFYSLPANDSKTYPAPAMWAFMQLKQISPYAFSLLCGNLPQPFADSASQCCVSSLNASESGILSAADYIIPSQQMNDTDLVAYVPVSANLQTYCHIYNFTDPYLYPYQNGFYLADGSCIDMGGFTASCSPSGHLSLFVFENSIGCSGPNLTHQLLTTPKTFKNVLTQNTDGSYSYYTARLITFNHTTRGIVMNWVSYQPAYLLIPLFENVAEKVGLVSYGVAVLCSIGTVVFAAGLAIKKGSFENRLLCASQMFWLAWVCLQIWYTYFTFTNDSSLKITTVVKLWLLSLASVSTAVYTTLVFIKIIRVPERSRYLIYFLLVAGHLVLAGGQYAYVIVLFPLQWTTSESFAKFYLFENTVWVNLFPYWIMMMFVWDIIPLTGVVYRIASRGDNSRSCLTILEFILKIDALFVLTIFCQFILVGVYYTAAAMQGYSSILQNDRTWLSFNAYMQSILALHSVLNCSLIFRIKTILKKASSFGQATGGGHNSQTSGRGGRWAFYSIFSKKGRGEGASQVAVKKAQGLKAFDKSNGGSGDIIAMHATGSSSSPTLPSPTKASMNSPNLSSSRMKSPTFSSPTKASMNSPTLSSSRMKSPTFSSPTKASMNSPTLSSPRMKSPTFSSPRNANMNSPTLSSPRMKSPTFSSPRNANMNSPTLSSPRMKSPTFSSPSSAHSQVHLLVGNRSTNSIITSEAENDGSKNMPTVFTTDDNDAANPDPLKNWKKQATKKVGVAAAGVGKNGSGSGPLSRHFDNGGSGSDLNGNRDTKNMSTINSIVGDG